MARFEIKSKDGSSIRYTGKPRYNGSYLKPSFIEFAEISSPTPIAWEVGDYVDYPRTGMRYRLYSIPQPTKNARKGSHGNAFTYSGVQFHAATKELEIALFKDLVTADNNIHFSTSPDVATFENIEGIARRIQACMDYFFPNRWEIRIAEFDEVNDAEVLGKIRTAKDFALSGGTCLDALSKIYELWQDIGWVHTHENGKEVITIGYPNKRIDANTTDSFVYGKGNGLTAIKRNQTNREEFATRLYVYGSERNIPSRYYNGLDILNAESVDIRNLMLPLDRWGKTDGLPDARKAYLENAEAVAKYGLIPKTHYFDSEEAGADIYPSIEGMTIGRIRKVLGDMGQTQYVPNLDIYPDDSERVDKVLSAANPEDDGIINREGKQYDLTKSIDISKTDFTVPIPSDSAAEIVNETQIAFAQFIIDENSRGMVSMNPGMNIIVLGEQIASIRAVFELADSHYGPWKNVSQIKEVSAVSINATNWSIAMPQLNIKFTSEKRVFEAYLMMKLYITPASSSARTATVVFPSAPLNINFNRLLPTTFTMELKQIGFDIEERASVGKGKTISMKSGMCEGRNFAISEVRYNEGTDSWVLTCKRQQDDTLGMYFPNIPYEIKAGDEFVLLDIALPESYIRVAQERLLEEGQKLLARASKIQNHYEPSIDAKVMFESGRSLREGMFMEITDEDVVDNTTDYILIDTLNIYEDESAIPTYKVTLRERRKVTYKGTPSATSSNDTKPVEESVQESVSASVDLSNYYTKEEVNELIDEVAAGDVDLTNYYTKGEVDSKFATIDLSPYAKSADVAQTYATIESLNGVDNRLKGIEGYFATSEDAGTQIDKWNEIVAFLNATEGTTLAGILATYYTKTEIDGKITTINNSITSVDNKYASTKAWADTLASLIVNENGSVRIKANLIVDGDTASGGEGGSSSVGIQGIKLNGTTYRDENSDGIIDLGTISGGGTLTEITYEMIVEALGYTPANSASLGSLAYKNGLTASDVGALSTSGGTITGASGNYTPLIVKTTSLSEVWIVFEDTVGLTHIGSARGVPSINSGSGNKTIIHSGNYSSYALPLSGGTISGGLTIGDASNTSWLPISFNRNGIQGFIGSAGSVMEMGTNDGYLRVGGNVLTYMTSAGGNVLIHSGNIGDYAFTPRTQITSNTDADTLLTNGVYLNATGNGSGNSNFPGGYSILISATQENKYAAQISIASDGMHVRRKIDTWSAWKTIAFTDSDITGSARVLTAADGKTFAYANTEGHVVIGGEKAQAGFNTYIDGNYIAFRYGTSNTLGMSLNQYGNVTVGYGDLASVGYKLFVDGILGIGGSGNSQWVTRFVSNSEIGLDIQLGRNANNDKLPFSIAWRNDLGTPPFTINPNGNVLIGTTTDNGAKLQVEGDIHLGIARLCSIGTPYSVSDPIMYNRISIGSAYDGIKYYSGSWTGDEDKISHEFIVGVENKSALAITNGGNVIIGTTTDSGYRLKVEGTTYHSTEIYLANWAYLASYKTDGSRLLMVGLDNNNLLTINESGSGVNTAIVGGNVGIGTTNPQAKLDVAGNTTINGNLVVTGDISA